jgi:hypothetical protein
LLQIFNEISCRKVHNEINVFSGILTNSLFLGILVFTAAGQALIVEFGGDAFKVTGLAWDQWIGCIVCFLLQTSPFSFSAGVWTGQSGGVSDCAPHLPPYHYS